MRIGIVPHKISEVRFFQLVEEIMPPSRDGQHFSPADLPGQLHDERMFSMTRCESQKGQEEGNGLTREYALATAHEQSRDRMDWHYNTIADLARMQWIVGAVALEIVIYPTNPSPPAYRQSSAHSDIEVRTP